MSALYWTNTLGCILIVLAHSPRVEMSLDSDTLPDFKPTRLCPFSFILRVKQRSNKYQLYGLWFDLNGARTHDLPHSRRACYPLHRRCGYNNFNSLILYNIRIK